MDRSNPNTDITSGSGNVFKDVGFDDDEAAYYKARACLAYHVRKHIENQGMTQSQAAEFFGTSQPRISDLLSGKIDKFTIDYLIGVLVEAGSEVSIMVEGEKHDLT